MVHKCEYCNKNFVTVTNLAKHIKLCKEQNKTSQISIDKTNEIIQKHNETVQICENKIKTLEFRIKHLEEMNEFLTDQNDFHKKMLETTFGSMNMAVDALAFAIKNKFKKSIFFNNVDDNDLDIGGNFNFLEHLNDKMDDLNSVNNSDDDNIDNNSEPEQESEPDPEPIATKPSKKKK